LEFAYEFGRTIARKYLTFRQREISSFMCSPSEPVWELRNVLMKKVLQQAVNFLNCLVTVTFSRITLNCGYGYWVVGSRGGAVG
jgi:hypothetical protein